MEKETETPPEKTDFPEELYYSADGHYWVKVEDNHLRIGLTRLGAEIYRIKKIWLKPIGTSIAEGNALAGFVGDRAGGLDSPVSGTIVESNDNLAFQPSLIYNDPYNSGWIVVIKPSNLEEALKKLQKVTSEEFKKALEDRLKIESEKRKEPFEAVEAVEPEHFPGVLPDPFG